MSNHEPKLQPRPNMERFDIYFPPDTLTQIDALKGDVSRAAWVRRAVEERIERVKKG